MSISPPTDTGLKTKKRPVSVTLLAWLYIAVGSIGFAYHLEPIVARHGFHSDDLLIQLTEIVAVVAGVFILQGENWARWLAVTWIAFHVFISFFDSVQKITIHFLLFMLIAYLLFQPKARRYFQHLDEIGT